MKVLPLSAVLAALSAGSAGAQLAALAGPASGLFHDAFSRSVRPVVGFPGSSRLGPPVLSGLEKAFLAPDGDSALILEGGVALLVRGLQSGNLARFPLPALDGALDHLRWAANSAWLVAYSASARRLQWVDVQASVPRPGPAVDLSHLEGEVTELAASHDASQTVIGLRHPLQGGHYALSQGAPPLRLSRTPDPGPAIFGPIPNALLAADRETGRLLRFAEGIYGGCETLTFEGPSEPLADPVGLALSPDGQRLYLAAGSSRRIREYDLRARRMLAEIHPDVQPQALEPLAATPTVFLLSPRQTGRQPLWLLDVRAGMSVTFVPAGE